MLLHVSLHFPVNIACVNWCDSGTEVLSFIVLCLFPGGNTSTDNNPKHDGDDGTSFLGPDGEPFLYPLKGNVEGFLFPETHISQWSHLPRLHLTP